MNKIERRRKKGEQQRQIQKQRPMRKQKQIQQIKNKKTTSNTIVIGSEIGKITAK